MDETTGTTSHGAVDSAGHERPASEPRAGAKTGHRGPVADFETVTVRALVIGAGAAGARTAIELVERGVDPADVLVIGKRAHGDAHTTWARGGVNGTLGTRDPEDDWTIHAADTLREGGFLNDPAKVEAMTRRMPELLRELDEWGMAFSRTPDGEIDQRYFGAQSFRRTAFAGDHTGESMLETLVARARNVGVPHRENVLITRLLTVPGTDEGGDGDAETGADGDTDADSSDRTSGDDPVTTRPRIVGAAGVDLETGRFVAFGAELVVLAAGGYTGLYRRHSSRDDENTGDALALAYEAGAALADVEFVQFHPTGMVGARYGDEWDGRLVTEAVRGEGGRLYNAVGERFMERYSPTRMELDARDVVARAIAREIDEGRGTDSGGVYLDVSHRERAYVEERLPRMVERFAALGVDMAAEPVEVAPTAHYGMGGVVVDEAGETAVDGLYAVGEATAGVHGANRLGGNSLAETLAGGVIVGEAVATRLAGRDARTAADGADGEWPANADADRAAASVQALAWAHFEDLAAMVGGGARPGAGTETGSGDRGDVDGPADGDAGEQADDRAAGGGPTDDRVVTDDDGDGDGDGDNEGDGAREDPESVLSDLRALLWAHAGILRDEAGLRAGLDQVARLRERADGLWVGDTTSRSFEFAVDVAFALVVAEAILRTALERTESRGAHFRTDHPERAEAWTRTIVVRRGHLGGMALSTAPVGEPSPAVQAALDAGYELDYHQLE
jgi:succinate dehydrogenase / fumarate reductase flavoprotein subunit